MPVAVAYALEVLATAFGTEMTFTALQLLGAGWVVTIGPAIGPTQKRQAVRA